MWYSVGIQAIATVVLIMAWLIIAGWTISQAVSDERNAGGRSDRWAIPMPTTQIRAEKEARILTLFFHASWTWRIMKNGIATTMTSVMTWSA
jgi:hypothetical protein